MIQIRFQLGFGAVEHSTYCSGCPLATNLAQSIRVLWIDIVVFFQREGVVVRISLCKTDAICCLTAGNEDLFDTQFACCSNGVRTAIGNQEHRNHIPASITL